MKKKILLSLSSFVIVSVLIGAVSIINSSNKISSNQTNSTLQTNPENIFVASQVSAMDIEVPSCGDELADCFPIVNGVDTNSQEANIQLAWKRISKYKSNGTKTPIRYNTQTPATAPTTTPTPVPAQPAQTLPTPIVTPAQTPTPAPTQSAQNINRNISWGAFLPDSSSSSVSNFESQVGAQMDIIATFTGWGNGASDFPDWLVPSTSSGKTMLIFWEATANDQAGNVNQPNYNYDSIINGSWDGYITTFAKEAKKYGGPIILIPFDEMNSDWYPWSGTKNGNTPAKHNAAYRHIHDIFVAQNVTNVKWGWAPNNDSVPNTATNDIANYYPGDAYVDYVGLDGFNFNNSSDPWRSYSQMFSSALAKISVYNKPIYLFSFASAEANDGGTKKAAWITDALTQIKNDSRIAGLVWFNENKEQNWLINSTSKALQAFSAIIQTF